MFAVALIARLAERLFVRALSGVDRPASESGAFHHNECAEDYLIGQSDMDARWYYERKRWRS